MIHIDPTEKTTTSRQRVLKHLFENTFSTTPLTKSTFTKRTSVQITFSEKQLFRKDLHQKDLFTKQFPIDNLSTRLRRGDQPNPPSMASESTATSGRGRTARKRTKMAGRGLWPHATPPFSPFSPAPPGFPPLTRRTFFRHSGHHWKLSLIWVYHKYVKVF